MRKPGPAPKSAGSYPGILIFVFSFLSFAETSGGSPARVALIGIERRNTTELEVSIVSQYLRTTLVNSGHFTVLDRENIDKILTEQKMTTSGMIRDAEAVRVGKLLNVEMIIVGTLLRFGQEYFLESRIIDVESSEITASHTARCVQAEQLPDVARMSAEHLSGPDQAKEPVSPLLHLDSMDLDYDYPETRELSAAERLEKRKRMHRWKRIGFSSYDYERYSRSGLTELEWAVRDRKSPVLAATLGPSTGTSGFFYTRNYGSGMFITFAKAIGIAGMIVSARSGEVRETKFRVYGGVVAVATIGDVVGAVYAANAHNRRLEELKSSLGNLETQVGLDGFGLTYNRSF